jgi:DNA-binding NarL/FixJ family response regulator
MPGMGGQKCFEELLKIDPEAKIIIVSGYSATGKEQQILGSKAQGFLSKPYQMRELASKIEEIFAD